MTKRIFAVTAAGVGAAVLAAAGITYASTTESAPASPTAKRAAVSVRSAAKPAQPEAPAAPAATDTRSDNGNGNGNGNDGGDHNGGGRDGGGRDGGDHNGGDRDGGGRDHRREGPGRIYFNEREYSAASEGCVTAASGLGSTSFNVVNDSRKTIEVFRGFTCDNGAPVATVSPHGTTNGVVTPPVQGGLFGLGDDGVVGSFRVVSDDDEW